MINNTTPVTTRHDTTRQIQPGSVGVSAFHRQWLQLSQGDNVQVEPLDMRSIGNEIYLSSLDVDLGFWNKRLDIAEQFSADDIAATFIRLFSGHIFSPGQVVVFEYHGTNMRGDIRGVNVVELASMQRGGQPQESGHRGRQFGLLMDQTDITFLKAEGSLIKLKSSAKKPPPNAVVAPNFKFEDMGIGGLDSEFSNIFRRAFASRVFPPGLVEKLGIQHVRGILLFGPPGTGKTLMARQIGKMLNAREPKIVNGPEILNKFVGQSEENIRKLFADAEKEYKAKGDESGLHIIIFDELDAICKQRGSTGGGTGVGDSVVNQLLSKMDGVDQLNNILIIGMTNRLDMIDEALLRPGRLEVHMEISLPDEKGRFQIITIHTAKMRSNGIMDDDVDLAELAQVTKNFSGAEIAGLVKSATSFAFNRHIKVGTMAGISDDVENMRVNRQDFLSAMDEVHPAFGVSEEELLQVVQNGIIHYDPIVDTLLHEGKLLVDQVRTSTRTPLVSLLLHGPPGSGKTALAATIAQASGFPFIKLISPDNMVGFGEAQKVAAINKVFMDSYKSPLSVIVVDNIERLLDWVPIGARFSNAVLQALLVLFGRRPPKGRRLLIIATTSTRPLLTDIQMADVFDAEKRVPPIASLDALLHVLKEVELFRDDREISRAAHMLRQAGLGDSDDGEPGRLMIGVKKLLSVIEMSRQEPDQIVESLVNTLVQLS
ncbi:AAA-domain-containing protein [Exidia glandulosa HHB12029]|uniref:Vesicular-fusion protein SEC18 n=1 Tax=Exidia glandulosa HHB12029 TaxID=1314781 RepID=A0A165J2E7_EXIGL|nr:AAA-domain-containing protein [Exidia glandulosa HHB12029]